MKKYFACLALFAAVMYVGCSDYLDEFKDEYEGQFAQKVDDPKDEEISSDSHNPVMSSGVENNKNSSDSKDLKSSSSGKGSSSASSSSVAGGDAANRCGGTVIYDASINPNTTVFGTKFEYVGDGGDGYVPADENGLAIELVYNSYALLDFDGVKDISSWEGICIEYTADDSSSLNFIRDRESGDTEAAAVFSIAPASKLQKYEAKWVNAERSNYFDELDFGYVEKFSFGGENVKLVVSRITTVNKVGTLFSRNCSEDDTTCFYWNGNESVNMKDCHPDSAWAVLIPPSGSESRLLTKAGDTLGGKIGSQIIPNSAFVGCEGICGTFIPMKGKSVLVSLSHTFAADLTKEDGICMSYLSSADYTEFILSKETDNDYSKMSGNLEKATSVKMVNVKWSDLSKDFFPEVTFENFFEGDVIISVNLRSDYQKNVKFNIFEIGSYGTCKGDYEVPDWFKSN